MKSDSGMPVFSSRLRHFDGSLRICRETGSAMSAGAWGAAAPPPRGKSTGFSIAATIVAPMPVNVVLSLADSLRKPKDVSLTNDWLSSFLGDLTLSVGSGRRTLCLLAALIDIPVFVFVGMRINRKIEL